MSVILEELKFTLLVIAFHLVSSRSSGVRFSPRAEERLKAHRRMLHLISACVAAVVASVLFMMARAGLSWRAFAGFGGVLVVPLSLGAHMCVSDYRRERDEELARSVLEV